MAQTGGGSGRRRSGGAAKRSSSRSRTSQAKKSSSRSTQKSSSRSTRARSRSRSSASASTRKAAAKKGGQARGRQQRAQKQARRTATAATKPADQLDLSSKNVAELREALRKNLVRPLDLLMLTRERIEEVMNEAVERGRVTAADAQDLIGGLVQNGRKQTNDVLGDLEQLLGRGRGEVGARTGGARRRGTDAARRARRQVEDATTAARTRAVKAADPALAQADRVRRVAGVGPSFPILEYDELTAAQVQGRLGGLTPPELRKVRDYERRHANRKTVLTSIADRLG